MVDLTGGVPERINIKPSSNDAALTAVWSRLIEAEQRGWPLAFQYEFLF
jgi:hypothetical protein